MLRIVVFGLVALCSLTANAATWYVFANGYTDNSIYFFDRDTVTKHGDDVTIWEKYVRDADKPEADGSISTALKVNYSCGKRTSQIQTYTAYDLKGDFIRSSSIQFKAVDVIPDSVGEAILKVVCIKNFPKSKVNVDYFSVKDNDIFSHTKNYFAKVKASTADIEPHNATWYYFVNGISDTAVFFFEYNSIEKQGNAVTLLEKFIRDSEKAEPNEINSMTQKITYFCDKRTSRTLARSSYNKKGELVFTSTDESEETVVKSNTLAESMLTAVCSADFPQAEGSDLYKPIAADSDVYAAAHRYFDYLKAAKDDPAPK